MHDLKNIIESLLFVAEEPLPMDKLRVIIETAESREIRAALQALADEYEQRGGGFRLLEVAGGWQIRSRPEYHEWIRRMLQPAPQRLSKAALETLALVAYKQPIIRADIEHIRGVDCGGVLRQLLERKLVRVLGRREIAGRPLIYATTKLFLEMFELKDLNDLPTPKEIADFGGNLNAAQENQIAPAPLEQPQSPSQAATRESCPSEALPESPAEAQASDKTENASEAGPSRAKTAPDESEEGMEGQAQ
ncbi:MAG: SMC-Scp complex subunit ScpB [Desulfobacteraceae bacterium]|nr:MAG: SMC-Scp complex subunit ScpB [Desulfobacteraceae bacterium]